MNRFAPLPEPPYYAVIFTTQRSGNLAGYGNMAERMEEMAAKQPGYIGMESTCDEAGTGITVSYWRDEESIAAWKAVAEHAAAQEFGKTRWYEQYVLRVARVERAYSGPDGR